METTIQKYKDIKTQADAVLHFLQHLDIDMVDSVLEPNRTYQEFEKHIFVRKLGYAIDEFIDSGDTYLHLNPGQCNAEICNFGCKGFRFVGNHSGNFFDLLFEIKDGEVQDICECMIFKCFSQSVSKNRRIIIDTQ